MTDYEEYDLTGEDGEDSALNFTSLAQFGNGQAVIPGLLKGAIVDAEASEPYARNGLLHIPAGEIEGTTTPTANSATGRFGIVGSVQPGNAWGIADGLIYVGVADAGSAGVISSANFKALQGKTPTFTGGALNLPLAQATLGVNGTSEDTPGGLVGIGYSDDGCFGIVDGYARIPKPTRYEFDPEWFEVIDGQVTLKGDALASVIEELASEMSVEVEGSGVLEQTYRGTLKANTAGSLTLNTNVSY